MASNPFADLIPQQNAQPQAQQPFFIPPRQKQPTPLELQRESRAAEDQQMQRQQFQATLSRQDQAAQREQARDQRAAIKDAEGNDGERTAAFLATRLAGSLKDIKDITASDPSAASPELDTALLGGIVGRGALNSSPRNRVEDAQIDILDSALTLGTGAAYTREQLEGYRESFFPQYWDSPEAIKDKEARLNRVLEAARVKAGRAAPAIDEALKRSQAPSVNNPSGSAVADKSGFGGFDPDGNLIVDVVGGRKPPDVQAEIDRRSQTGMVGAGLMGAADTLTFGALDEIGAGVDAAFGSGSGSFGDRYDRALTINRGVQENVQQQNPGSYLTGQVAGGVVLPSFGARSVGQLARLGAGYGGAYGFGSANGDLGDRLVGGGIGAGTGAALGGALGYLGNLGANRLGRGTPPDNGGAEIMAAAQRQGVDVLPADVGGPMTRRFTSTAAQGPLSAGPIIRGGQRAGEQMQGARDRIASGVGQVVDPFQAGEVAQTGASNYVQRSRQQVGGLYDQARATASNARPVAQRAINVLDSNLAELAETPATSGPVTAALEKLGGDLSGPSGLSIDALRRLRTNVRGIAQTDELRGTDFQRRAGQVLDAISEDIADGLPSAQARAQFRAADVAHRERIETIDEVIKPIIGGRNEKAYPPERVFQNLQNATRSDTGKLRRFMGTLNPDEQASLRATVISQLGRASNGAQNAEGTAFSPAQFLTHWNQLAPRAKDVLFRGEARDALNDLARIADGTKQAQGYANRSNTGGALAGNIGGWLGLGSVAPTTAALGAAGQMISGRLLASPRFARWLARPARSPEEVASQARRLTAIAAREPAIANDILPIREALSRSIQSVAATPNVDQRRQ